MAISDPDLLLSILTEQRTSVTAGEPRETGWSLSNRQLLWNVIRISIFRCPAFCFLFTFFFKLIIISVFIYFASSFLLCFFCVFYFAILFPSLLPIFSSYQISGFFIMCFWFSSVALCLSFILFFCVCTLLFFLYYLFFQF